MGTCKLLWLSNDCPPLYLAPPEPWLARREGSPSSACHTYTAVTMFYSRNTMLAEAELNSKLDCQTIPAANSWVGQEYITVNDLKYDVT
jgi:hypothetical protein